MGGLHPLPSRSVDIRHQRLRIESHPTQRHRRCSPFPTARDRGFRDSSRLHRHLSPTAPGDPSLRVAVPDRLRNSRRRNDAVPVLRCTALLARRCRAVDRIHCTCLRRAVVPLRSSRANATDRVAGFDRRACRTRTRGGGVARLLFRGDRPAGRSRSGTRAQRPLLDYRSTDATTGTARPPCH